MKRFIEQEAREKAEEIQIKVWCRSNGGHLLEPPANLVVLFPDLPIMWVCMVVHVGEGVVVHQYKFVCVVNNIAVIYELIKASTSSSCTLGSYVTFQWQPQIAM